MRLVDPQSREINNLRISVTQRCNLDCIYCHREGEKTSGEEMTVEQISRIVESAAELGIEEVKITGGEPLMREDIEDIVARISSINGILDVSMTTNGILLEKYAEGLKNAGLNRVNIGCDSLTSNLDKNGHRILPGILAAKKAGITPIKINMVVLKGINDHEIDDMIGFARKHEVILQLIELVPLNKPVYDTYRFNLGEIERRLYMKADGVITRGMQSRRQYILDDVVVEVVRPCREFCMNCSRLRITSDGMIKPCLMRDDNLVDTAEGDIKSLLTNAVTKRGVYYEN